MAPLDETFRRLILQQPLIRAGDSVLAGVSGGADSMALLHLLAGLRPTPTFSLTIVHVDHQLRADSQADAAFVEEQGRRLDVPVLTLRRDVAALAARERLSIEDAARRARYDAFADAGRRTGASALMLAHTADDQAETVLMRLLRGSGLTGLSGIPPARAHGPLTVLRPLLGVWRREIAAYLRERGLPCREDASNADLRFTRNRIRRELLPLLEREYNPNIKAALVQLAEQVRCDAGYVAEASRRHQKRLVKTARGERSVRTAAFRRQPPAIQRQLIRFAIQDLRGDLAGFEFRHWRELEQLFTERPVGAIVDLPDGLQAVRGRDRVTLRLVSATDSRYTKRP